MTAGDLEAYHLVDTIQNAYRDAKKDVRDRDDEEAPRASAKSQAGVESHYRDFINTNFGGKYAGGFDEFKKCRTQWGWHACPFFHKATPHTSVQLCWMDCFTSPILSGVA
jgi:hypothetical protein